ncbi:hypothetical protein INQ30_23395 [Escherichia coli]|nr:hypothetical protein [Escherichia coli]
MARCPNAERQLMDAFTRELRDHPSAMAVAGVIEVHEDGSGYRVAVGFVDNDPVTLAALAQACLERAADQMVTLRLAAGFPELWENIERAKAALCLVQPGAPS